MSSGILYLIPVALSDSPIEEVLPVGVISVARSLRHFVVEDIRTARRMLKRMDKNFPIGECEFRELNVKTPIEELPGLLSPLEKGIDVGLMSEAGCPAVADPGSGLVLTAQRRGIQVRPLSGPSSILMSLMASGFNGQGFAFNGYLPIDAQAKIKRIRELESLCGRTGQTQIFIETPYRNDKFVKLLTETLRGDTLLCIATNLTGEDETVITRSVSEWRKRLPEIGKRPTIFLIHRP